MVVGVRIDEDFIDSIGLYSLTCLLRRVNAARGLEVIVPLGGLGVVLDGIAAGF
jgi:hypothetical protein